jgi:hypothetical protein
VAVPDPLQLDATHLAIGGWGAWGDVLQGAEERGLEMRLPGVGVERSVARAQGGREPVAPALPMRWEKKPVEPERGKPDEARSAARSCAEEVSPAAEEQSAEPAALPAEGQQSAQTPPRAQPQLVASPGEREALAGVQAPVEASGAWAEPRPVRSPPGREVAEPRSGPPAEVALAARPEA